MDLRETTQQCLTFDNRSSTPPHIKKYRRSTYLEPGRRFQHYGMADDYENLHLSDKIYGITDKTAASRNGAADLINHKMPSELEKTNCIICYFVQKFLVIVETE